jgi:predicted RNA methylase
VERARKLRGAYFTPRELARKLCAWAVREPNERILDPSCGDGAFLAEARALGARVTGVDIHRPSLDDARRNVPDARLVHADFFDYCSRGERFDTIVGNPPFIRYQQLAHRDKIVRMADAAGASLSSLANAWAPFAVLASRMLRPGGRMALVIPREALFVNYGREVFRYLRENFRDVRVETLEGFHFEDALQKVALLLCDGAGESGRAAEEVSWRARELDRKTLQAYQELSKNFVPLSTVARVKLGIVTGDKDFFVLDRESIRHWNIPKRNLLPVLDSTPKSLRVTSTDQSLLWTEDPSAVRRYLAYGESKGVSKRYKCRIRTPWHRLNLGVKPDAFLTYLVYDRPRLASNEADAYCTNNFHGVYTPEPLRLAAAFMNPVTLMGIELIGRVYGGGVLKIEPGDAARILVPPKFPTAKTALEMDALNEKEALAISNRWLEDDMSLSASRLGTVLSGYLSLRESRLQTGRKRTARAPV